MKKSVVLLVIILIIGSCERENALEKCSDHKYLLAGQTLHNCYEIIDIKPDEVISPYTYKSTKSSGSKSYFMDLDGNLESDIKITVFYTFSAGGWTGYYGTYITSINPLIEYNVRPDSCYMNIYNYGDTIYMIDTWIRNDGEMRISYTYLCNPPACCESVFTSTNDSIKDKYIGLRMVDNPDNRYYWIRLDIEESNIATIKEFGRAKY